MKRLLSPATNSPGILALLNLLYAVAAALLAHYHQAIGLSVADVAAIDAAALAYIRTQVTPVTDPRDGNGTSLRQMVSHPITVDMAPFTNALDQLRKTVYAALSQFGDTAATAREDVAAAFSQTDPAPAAEEPLS